MEKEAGEVVLYEEDLASKGYSVRILPKENPTRVVLTLVTKENLDKVLPNTDLIIS